jgi:hypothetical protein
VLTPLKRGCDFEVVTEGQRGLIEEEVEPTSTGLHRISRQWKSGRIKCVAQIMRPYVASRVVAQYESTLLIPAEVLQLRVASLVPTYFTHQVLMQQKNK